MYQLQKWCRNVSVVEMWGIYQLQKWGGMCCGNVGYVSVAEMGVCVVEMGGTYQLQKWGYVLRKCGVCATEMGGCISCRNGGGGGGGGGGEVQIWGVCFAEMGSTTIQALDMCQVKLCNETCDVM